MSLQNSVLLTEFGKIQTSKVLKNFSDFGTFFFFFLTNGFWNIVAKYLVQNHLVVSLIYIYIYVCVCVFVWKRNLQ